MAYSIVLDDLAEIHSTSKPGMSRITAGFNAALLAFQAVAGFLMFLASDRARTFPLASILFSSSLDLARFVVLMLFSAWFIRAFWRRLVVNLATIRPIDYQEALAIALMASLLVGR